MSSGIGSFVALLLAFCVCLLHPGIPALIVLGVVAGCVWLELSRPTEDGERIEEQDE